MTVAQMEARIAELEAQVAKLETENQELIMERVGLINEPLTYKTELARALTSVAEDADWAQKAELTQDNFEVMQATLFITARAIRKFGLNR